MMVVVDASVAIKWFLPEIHAEVALKLLKSKHKLVAPDLIWVEVGNVLWKKNFRKEISIEESRNILKDFLRFPLQMYSAKSLVSTAFNFATQYRVTVYDSLYLALAVGCNCPLVTADRKFFETLTKENIKQHLLWIEDVK